MEDTQWFERLASVPGVQYVSHPDVDRRTLPQYDAKPKVNSFTFDGHTRRSLSWETPDGSTSRSPAAEWGADADRREAASVDLLRRLHEAVELPGTVADYHFALLGAYQVLWGRRKREPELLPEIEKLLLLDVSLVEAQPERIAPEIQGERIVPHVPAFHYLVSLYEREGFLHEALDIAKRAVKVGQGSADEERLIARIAELEAEDAS
jgi:hypothetical protein